MIDPISAFALATAAYNAVKQGIEVGKEMHEISGALGKFFTASTDLKQAAEETNKPSIFKKLLHKDSIEQQALDNVIRRRTVIKQEYDLMMMVKLSYGEGAYQEMMEERRKISVDRIKADKLQKARQKQLSENVFLYSLLMILLYLCYLLFSVLYELTR